MGWGWPAGEKGLPQGRDIRPVLSYFLCCLLLPIRGLCRLSDVTHNQSLTTDLVT